jgi:hypothetical protein
MMGSINGQKKLWEKPWSNEKVAHMPCIHGVDISDGIEFLRAVWDNNNQSLVATLRTWYSDITRQISVRANSLLKGLWEVAVNGVLVH